MVHTAAVSTAGPTLAGCTGWSEVIFPQVQQVLRVIVVEAVMEDLAELKVGAGRWANGTDTRVVQSWAG